MAKYQTEDNMIIKGVPFIKDRQEKCAPCQGPSTLMMVIKFFKPKIKISCRELYNKLSYKKGEWFFETYIVKLLHESGISSKYYGTQKIRTVGNDSDYFKKLFCLSMKKKSNINEVNTKHYDSSVKYAISNNLFKRKKSITVDFIKKILSSKKLVIATVNRNVLTKMNGFRGHFMLIKGFDEKNFVCNDAYLGESIYVPFSTFKKAFYSSKTKYSQDIISVG
jgi:hypothetical protein